MSRHLLAGGMESLSTMPPVPRRKAFTTGKGSRRLGPLGADVQSDHHRRRLPFDMSITVAHNCAVEYGLTRGIRDAWALRSHQRAVKAVDAGFVRRRDRADPGAPAGRSTITLPRTSIRAATPRWSPLAGLKVLHPEIEGFSVTAGNSSGHQRRRRGGRPGRPDATAVLAHIPVLDAGGRCPKHRQRTDLRHPEGTRPGRPEDLRRRAVRDQRGRSRRRPWPLHPAARPRRGDRQRPTARASVWATRSRHRRAHGHLGHPRAASPRRRHRRAVDVRRRRHGRATMVIEVG